MALELERLGDVEDIKVVKARYCRFVDTKNWEGLAALFTEDAVLDVTEDSGGMPPFEGRDTLMAQIVGVCERARTAHHVHSPDITFDGPDRAEVIWAMQDRVIWEDGASPIAPVRAFTGYGHYTEQYVRQGGEWRIASLRLTRTVMDMEQ